MTKQNLSSIKKVVLGISGSIAAYKAIDLGKLLVEQGFDLDIVLSKSAPEFVSILTLRSLFPGKVHLSYDTLDKQDAMLHISLAKSADLVLIAPGSANMLSKLANGFADCLLSTICLATKAPIVIAPAMNKVMWENTIFQSNIEKLQQNEIQIIGPSIGIQACGDYGLGRMLEPIEILEYLKVINLSKLLKNKKVVITAGPTREKIDPVRFLSNYSSGKMGYAIAKMAALMGSEVILISGPSYLAAPHGVKLVQVESADQMFESAREEMARTDIFIGAAAVADYKPNIYQERKIKKDSAHMTVTLEKNVDIISNLKQHFPDAFYVGFAAETNGLKEYGQKKLIEKKLDMIVINDVSDHKVFDKDDNEVHIITKDKQHIFVERDSKSRVAQVILEAVAKRVG